jgi:pimeloyl-ACP methyl ester carboxylesterase
MVETLTSPPHRSWLGRVAGALLTLLIVLAVAGMIYENISEVRDRRFNPPAGRLVNVGGRKMHIDCTGQGDPTVILDSGLGDSYLSWRKVQPEIAKFTRVCSYDRAGIGYSESSSHPRTARVIAEELHALLQAAGVAPPYILVGHSMGGFDVRLYYSLYPKEVAGVVLVDASHPDQMNRLPAAVKKTEATGMLEAEFLDYAMLLGIPRLLGLCDEDPRQRAAECNFHTDQEAIQEMRSIPESAHETAAAGNLDELPLAVVSHDPEKPSAMFPPDVAKATGDVWEKMQEELAHLSSRGTQTIAKGSAHYIQLDRREVVIAAIRNIWNEARALPTEPPTHAN